MNRKVEFAMIAVCLSLYTLAIVVFGMSPQYSDMFMGLGLGATCLYVVFKIVNSLPFTNKGQEREVQERITSFRAFYKLRAVADIKEPHFCLPIDSGMMIVKYMCRWSTDDTLCFELAFYDDEGNKSPYPTLLFCPDTRDDQWNLMEAAEKQSMRTDSHSVTFTR